MVCSVKNKNDLGEIEEIADSKASLKQLCLEKKFGKQGFHNDTKEHFEQSTKAITDITGVLLEQSKGKTVAIENFN